MMAKKKTPRSGKPNPLGLPGIGPTTSIDGKGRILKRTLPSTKEDPREANLDARCRAMGLKPSSHNRHVVNLPYLSHDLGRVLQHEEKMRPVRPGEIGAHQAVLRLWAVWQAFCQAEATYRSRILGLQLHARGAGLVLVAERVEATSDDEPDVRTAEERDEDARRAHRRWCAIMDLGMDPSLRVALHAAERGDGPALWQDGHPTAAGYTAARALRHLAWLAERGAL